MSKKFVIGDRLKDEWISVLDTDKKKLEFTNHLASAKESLLDMSMINRSLWGQMHG